MDDTVLSVLNLPPKALESRRDALARLLPTTLPPAALLAIRLNAAAWRQQTGVGLSGLSTAARRSEEALGGWDQLDPWLRSLTLAGSPPSPDDDPAAGPCAPERPLPARQLQQPEQEAAEQPGAVPMRLPVPPPPPSPSPELLPQQLAQQPQLPEEQPAGSPANGSPGKACLPCNALAAAAGGRSSPRKAGGGGRCKCGSSSSTAAPRPSWGRLYIAACTCWPTMALRLLEVAVPLLLLLLPSGRSTGSALLQAAWRGATANGPTPSTQLLVLAQLCFMALQLLCVWQASRRASWRLVMGTDAAHLALVAVVCAQRACVLLAAVALVVPRLVIIGNAVCRASVPAGKPQPLHRRLLHSQLHLACWQQ